MNLLKKITHVFKLIVILFPSICSLKYKKNFQKVWKELKTCQERISLYVKGEMSGFEKLPFEMKIEIFSKMEVDNLFAIYRSQRNYYDNIEIIKLLLSKNKVFSKLGDYLNFINKIVKNNILLQNESLKNALIHHFLNVKSSSEDFHLYKN